MAANVLNLINDIYSENSTQLLTAKGLSDNINVSLGAKQCCPLSGPMFNLTIDSIFFLVQYLSDKYHILGNTDNISLFEDSPEALRESINKVCDFLGCLGLTLNS